MSEELANKKALVKELIKTLHEGGDVEQTKRQFGSALRMVTPTEIAQIEEELIQEGMPREEIERMCDVHLAVFKETLEKEKPLAQPGHPIFIQMEEHTRLLKFTDELRRLHKEMSGMKDADDASLQVLQVDLVVEHLRCSNTHYSREENVIFPYLERHGITQPPAIMWAEHDRIREIERRLFAIAESRTSVPWSQFLGELGQISVVLAEMLANHFYKENNVLFPTALKVFTEQEWQEARRAFDDLGYCTFTPKEATVPLPGMEHMEALPATAEGERIRLETGSFTPAMLEAFLNTLPLDITFVNSEDTVQYFSQGRDRFFPRTVAVIGRKVQQCHPQKSLAAVNQILEDFHNARRDVAEFWIDLHGHFIHIRYFAVRDKSGQYLGCLETVQDITEIKKLQGEKRLL